MDNNYKEYARLVQELQDLAHRFNILMSDKDTFDFNALKTHLSTISDNSNYILDYVTEIVDTILEIQELLDN